MRLIPERTKSGIHEGIWYFSYTHSVTVEGRVGGVEEKKGSTVVATMDVKRSGKDDFTQEEKGAEKSQRQAEWEKGRSHTVPVTVSKVTTGPG